MSDHRSRKTVIPGLILITLGVLFLLDNFRFLDFGDFISDFWPLILVAIGVNIILKHNRSQKDDYTTIDEFGEEK